MRLSNKKAIVTGANKHIGQAIAIALAQEGADVVISYRTDSEGASQTINNIQKTSRGASFYADFSKSNDVEIFFKKALDFLGNIDILVNNAGSYNTDSFLKLNPSDLEYLLKVGVSAPFLLGQMTAKHMIENSIEGSIINISSISGNRPYNDRLAHSVTKASLNMLTQSMALELSKYNVRVNCIAPGYTPLTDEGKKTSFNIPLGRAGTPTDLANAVLFLASNESSWITGQILTIDGGQSLSF